jgi:hypothetical protein
VVELGDVRLLLPLAVLALYVVARNVSYNAIGFSQKLVYILDAKDVWLNRARIVFQQHLVE